MPRESLDAPEDLPKQAARQVALGQLFGLVKIDLCRAVSIRGWLHESDHAARGGGKPASFSAGVRPCRASEKRW